MPTWATSLRILRAPRSQCWTCSGRTGRWGSEPGLGTSELMSGRCCPRPCPLLEADGSMSLATGDILPMPAS
eukprot:3627300-Rhodomonas_salina.1